MVYGPRFYNEAYSENGVRIVRITDLTRDGELDFESMPRLDVSASDQARYLLSPGDILFARTGATVGKIALIRNGDPPCIAGAYFVKLVFGSLINPTYARFSLTSEATQAIIKAGSRQAAQQNFSGPGIRRLKMLVPPIDSQVDFANKVEMIEKSKALCLEQLRKCNVLFSSLQKYAFSGPFESGQALKVLG
jgi:type I restriction enzyme S subunit